MKKPFWSAFAVSLILLSNLSFSQTEEELEFLGLERELLPDLYGQPHFTPSGLFEDHQEWNVKAKQVELDKEPIKSQKYSLIPWETQDPEDWLDVNKWIVERDIKDQIPDWKMRLRDESHAELVGKLIQCYGSCKIFRGTSFAKGTHLSRLTEGDELRTDKDSVAWIYLMDGTILRVSSNTSISLLEINLSSKEIFFHIRLNEGHVFWHPRSIEKLTLTPGPETDAISLPLLIKEANQEHFERQLFNHKSDLERLAELMTLDDEAIKLQFEKINEMRSSLGPSKLKTKVLMVAPNATLVSSQVSFDLVSVPDGKTFFKAKHLQESGELSLHLRGYNVTQTYPVTADSWHEVQKDGRAFEPLSNPSGFLQVTELITKRIKSLELAREIWFEKFTTPILKATNDPKTLALTYGYTIWDQSWQKRYDYLVEYTRRVETTNLKSIENLFAKLEVSGEKVNRELSDAHYRESLNHYLMGLKRRYTDKKMEVREMSDLQYYVWILHHGKF